MSSDYSIKDAHCDLCGGPDMSEVNQEFADLFHDHAYHYKPEVLKSKAGSPLRQRFNEFQEKYRRVYASKAKVCFRFEADCHGDEICICKACLVGIVAEIEAKEKENT